MKEGPHQFVSRHRGVDIWRSVEGFFYFPPFYHWPRFNTAWSAVIYRDEELSP